MFVKNIKGAKNIYLPLKNLFGHNKLASIINLEVYQYIKFINLTFYFGDDFWDDFNA